MRLMLFIWLLGAAGLASPAWAQGPTPKADWLVLNDPAAAGWNPAALAAGRALADSLGTAAYMLIEDGRVVDSYGDITRAFRTHSMRKSFLSALYGVHLPELEPYLDRPLAELPIDDYLELTAEESMATLCQLLLSRSGIYRSAAYENPAFDRFRPERGSHPAGAFWFYSNRAWHPAYLFRMSTLLHGRKVEILHAQGCRDAITERGEETSLRQKLEQRTSSP